MVEVIQLFRERSTLDELGIGTIRDACADQLFVGTSTIQTRARLMPFVAWHYQRGQARRLSGRELRDLPHQDVVRLIDALRDGGADE